MTLLKFILIIFAQVKSAVKLPENFALLRVRVKSSDPGAIKILSKVKKPRKAATITACNCSMNGKPVYEREAKSVINFKSDGFEEKLLCDGITMSMGDACAYSCSFCYTYSILFRLVTAFLNVMGLEFHEAVIRRKNGLQILKRQLLDSKGKPRFNGPKNRLVLFTSPLVDPAANMTLVRETAEACNHIFRLTEFEVRILTKSNLLPHLVEMIPSEFHRRLILGVSTGTLQDNVAKAFEQGTPLVSKRIKSLHWLQDRGFRTFGMICPSLPQDDYEAFAASAAQMIRAHLCEHVWAEVINLRGESLSRTVQSLVKGGCGKEAKMLASVCGPGKGANWEEYARATFEVHARHIPAEKLRFLQYVNAKTVDWWRERTNRGAVLLGKYANQNRTLSVA